MLEILVWNVHNSVIADTKHALTLQECVRQKDVSEDGRAIRAVMVS